jgi:predicted nucleotide-binding protein
VFVVHGRDELAKVEVATFLKNIGLEPIVLSEQPNLGRIVLEKLEQAADAQYAIVLLTPDETPHGADEQPVRRKARQNVILELGFLVGRLGHRRVCALYKPPIELPSDFHGILYTQMDKVGQWRGMLIQELREAGLPLSVG